MTMVGFLKVFGYQTPSSPTGWNIATADQQLFSSLMVVGGVLGSLAQGFFSPYLGGRRRDMQIGSLFGMTAAAIMIGTTSIAAIFVARVLLGIANGIFITTAQMYIVEVLPPNLRGMALGFFAMVIVTAITLSSVITNFTKKLTSRLSYQIPLIAVMSVPVLIFILVQFCPESPRWLIMRGRDEDAKRALVRLRGKAYTKIEIAEEFAAMQAHHEAEHAVGRDKPRFFDLFKGVDRRRTLLSLGVVSTHVGSGTQFLVNYSTHRFDVANLGTYFFTMAHVQNPFAMVVVVNSIGIVGCIFSLYTVRLVGRRIILMFGTSACGFAMLISAAVYTANPGTISSGLVLTAMCAIYNFFYCGTISPYAWTVGAELTSQRLRSYTIGLGSALNFVLAWAVTFSAPYFINIANLNWGPKYCWIWFVSCFIMVAWFYLFLPETKDRTLEELDELFEARLPARKFRGYVCVKTRTAMDHGAAQEVADMNKEKVMVLDVEDVGTN
jgi:MFS transporter, SP family, sugar:H+ symporter